MGKDAKAGCLLIHGYGGSPFEMEGLASRMAAAGFAVRNICLPGHGETRQGFGESRFPHWLAFAESAFAQMAATCGAVVPIGFSMGGVIALNLAARRPAAGVVALSTPLYVLNLFPWPLTHARFYGASGMARLFRLLPFFRKTAQGESSRDIAPWKGYEGPINLPQLLSFRNGCAETRKLLSRLTAPLLVAHDARDRLVYCGNAWEIARLADSAQTTVIVTRMRENTTRHHLLPTHRETADLVAEACVRFAREAVESVRLGRKDWTKATIPDYTL